MTDSREKDLFDRIMALPGLKVFEPFYKRHKEVLLYLFFGGLSFLISTITFILFYHSLALNELIANVISWIITVLFVFFTNRVWVFKSATNGRSRFLRQIGSFLGGRIATLAVEELILYIFVTLLRLPGAQVKVAAQVVVIVLNYVISKWYVFK